MIMWRTKGELHLTHEGLTVYNVNHVNQRSEP